MRRRLLGIFLISLISVFSVFAQEEDSDWFWNQPITRIEFEGLKNIKKSELTGITSAYIDTLFTEDVYNDLLDRLYAVDYFEDIEPYAKHDTKNDSSVLLVFKVVEHPVVSKITFSGNQKVRNGELRELIKLKASDIFIESKILLEERTIRDHYIEKGYSEVKVSHKIEENEEGVNVIFVIQEGANTVIREIHVSGNSIVSERVLKSKLTLKEVGLFKEGAFQNSILELDKRTIISYYQERGYVDASIVDVKVDSEYNSEKQRQELIITFYIQEGYQYTFSGLTITGNEVFSTEELSPLMKLKVGSIFNATKFEEGIAEITGKYYENGYMSNEFYRIPNKDVERKEIGYTFSIKENVRSHIENVIIKGNSKTKDYVIRREIPIDTGDVFSREKVMNGVRNLYNLRYFSSIVPDAQYGSEENLVDVIFSVEEQSTTSLNFGMTFSGVSDPNDIPISLYFKLENSNFLGEGKSVAASTTLSKSEQSIDFSYAQNWLGKLPIAFSESLSFSHSNTYALVNEYLPDMSLNQYRYYMGYEGLTASLGTAFSRRWTPDFAILTAAAGMNNSLTNYVYDENIFTPVDLGLSLFANRWGLTNSLFTSFSMDDRDINYDPSEGWFASQRFAWYGIIPKLEQEFFLKSDTKVEGYLKLLDIPLADNYNFKSILAAYSGLTLLYPVAGSVISDSNKAYVDGMFNGRGWTEAYRAVGGRGRALWSNKLELRFPIVPNVVGIDLFHDVALVKDNPQDLINGNVSLKDFYFSFGPSLRFLIPQFPLNLMFTFRYRFDESGKPYWGLKDIENDAFQFVLSFNVVNR